jgi:hypothetical protein
MTHSFKLSRRIARLRAPILVTVLLGFAGCDNADPLNPDTSADPTSLAEEAAGPNEVGAAPVEAAEPVASLTYSGGIPFGTFQHPHSEFNSVYNGAMQTNGPQLLMSDLKQVKARGAKVVLMFVGSESNYKDGSGHFSLTKWKQRVNRFKGVNFSSYIKDGTIIGHYLIDEPHDAYNWAGRPISPATLEEMAKYSKSIWPSMATVVRVEPSYLRGRTYRYLDAAWAQYTARRGSASDYIRKNVSDAQRVGVSLIVGLNLLAGGNPNRTPMNANEVKSFGSALLNSSYPCAFISWKYNKDFLSRSGMRDAMATVSRKAKNRSFKSCRGS